MADLQIIVLSSAIGSAILAVALFALRRHDDNPALGWWAAALAVNAVRNVIVYLDVTAASPAALILNDACVVGEAALFLVGALSFVSERRFSGTIWSVLVLALFWLAAALALGVPFIVRTIPIYTVSAAALAITGWGFSSAMAGCRRASAMGSSAPCSCYGACWS
jgi:hypothetical protein